MLNVADNSADAALAPAAVDDACARVVAVFQSDSHARDTPALISRLRQDIVSAMVTALCDYQITLRIPRLSLLRALWSSPPLRTPVTLAFAQTSCLSSSSSHPSNLRPLTTSEEHGMALLLEELSYLMAVDARNTAKPVDQRLRVLSTRATDLARLIHESPSFSHNAVRLLVTCARAIAQIGSPASNRVYQRLVSHILLFLRMSQSYVHVSHLSAVLQAELSFAPSQHLLLESILERYISQPLPSSTIIPLLRALLSYTAARAVYDFSVDKLVMFILYILRNPQGDVLTDAIAVIEIYLHDFLHALLPRFVRVFSSLVRLNQPALQNGNLTLKLTSAHVTLLFSVLNVAPDEVARTALTSSLDAIFTSEVAFDTSLLPSSASAGAPSVHTARKAIISDCLRHPVVHVRSDVVLQYLQSLLWHREHSSTIVLFAFSEAFAFIPSCRPFFLQTMFASIFDRYTPVSVLKAYASIFEALTNSQHFAFAFAECKDILSEGLQQLAYVPSVIATRVTSCFVTVSIAIPSLADPVLVFLRKLAASRAHTHQRVACAGFISVFAHHHASPDAITGACDSLTILLDVARMRVRKSAIVRLLRFVSLHPTLLRRISPLIRRAISHLRLMNETDLIAVGGPSENTSATTLRPSLLSFFEEKDRRHVLKAPVAHLFRLCVSVCSQYSEAAEILKEYEDYLGNWGGALLDAVSTAKSDVPVAARVSLLCSLLQVICLSTRTGESRQTMNVTVNHWRMYGVALVVRDSIKSKEGMKKSDLLCDGTSEVLQPSEMTAREGVVARVESERFEDTGADDTVSLQVWVKALEALDKHTEPGLFVQTVQSEFLDGIRTTIENTRCDLFPTGEMNQSSFDWCEPLKECICRAFVRSSSWERDTENETSHQTEVGTTSRGEARTSSMSTMVTMNDSQSSSATSDKLRTADHCHSNDIHFLNGLNFQNEEISKLLCLSRLPRLESAAKTSVRESCLKISHMLITKGLVNDIWSFVRQLCEGSLSRSTSCVDGQSVVSIGARDTSVPVDEGDCVGAVQAITKLFQLEFSSSMTVYLTSLYIALMDVLLERIAEDGRNKDAVKTEVSATILGILREYSVRHVFLMRQMVKVLLRALDLDKGIAFGVALLEWLGNHAALVDSRYCGVDAVSNNRLKLQEFDQDIFEEGIRLDQDESTEEDDLVVADNVAFEKQNLSDTGEGDGNQGLPGSMGEMGESMNIIRSLCLNETADGAVTSICCIFSFFSDVLLRAMKCLKGTYLQSSSDVISELSRVEKVAEGLSAFVKGQFVNGCIGEGDPTEITHVNASFAKPLTTRPKRKRRKLSWPSDLEKKFGTVVFALMDVVDMELHTLAKEIGAESGRNLHMVDSLASSCSQTLRVLYDEANTLTVIECMRGELSLRWSVQERVEYAATLFMKRWNSLDKKKEMATPKTRLQRSMEGQCPSNAHDKVGVLASLVKRLLLDEDGGDPKSKKRRTGWWGQQKRSGVADIAQVAQDRTDFDRGDDTEGPSFMRVSKRQRIRSRNNYIDKLMLEDREQESFADLEDFVVEMGDEIN